MLHGRSRDGVAPFWYQQGDKAACIGIDVGPEHKGLISQKDVANMYSEFELSDLSLGLISRLGYHQFLADYLAQEIVAGLKDLYKV